MASGEMTGRERLFAAIRHEEPDRVPVSPRYAAWFLSEYGSRSLEEHLSLLPDLDFISHFLVPSSDLFSLLTAGSCISDISANLALRDLLISVISSKSST